MFCVTLDRVSRRKSNNIKKELNSTGWLWEWEKKVLVETVLLRNSKEIITDQHTSDMLLANTRNLKSHYNYLLIYKNDCLTITLSFDDVDDSKISED